MTAFPLPPNFFRCPELSADEKDYMINLAQKSLIDLVHHSRLEGGPIKWTLDSDEEGLQIYMGHDPTGVGSEMTFLCSTTEVMATFDEAASLFRSDTTELFREYIHNFGKDMLDAQSLYTLTLPTQENPRHYIGVKWMVLETPQGIMKNRDWCYLECQDDFVINGKRGWARSLNSIKLPCCPDLQNSLGLIRASFYRTGFVFLETERPGYLRVVHAVQMDLKGKVPKFIVRMGARRRARSIGDIDHFLREKRLSGEVFLEKTQLVALSARSKCFLCSKKFGAFTKKKSCRKCGEVVCSSCSKYWDINVNGLGRSMIRVCSACSVGTFNKGLPPLMSALTDNLSEQDSVEYGKRVVSHHSHQTPKMSRAFTVRKSGHEEFSMNIASKPQSIERSNNYEPEPEPPIVAANRQLLIGSRAIKQEQPFEPAAAPLNRAVRYSKRQNDIYRPPQEELPHSENGSHNGAGNQRAQDASYHSENESFDPRRYLEQNPRYQNQEPHYQERPSQYQDQPPRYQQDPRYNQPRQQDSRYMDSSFNDPRYINDNSRFYQKDKFYEQQNPYQQLRHVNEVNEFNVPQMYSQERESHRPQYPEDRYRPPQQEPYQQSNSSDRDDDPSFSSRAFAPLNPQTLAAFTAQGSAKPAGEFMVDPYYNPRRQPPRHKYEDDYYRYEQPQPRYYEDYRRPVPRRMNEYSYQNDDYRNGAYRNDDYRNDEYRNGGNGYRYNPFDDYQYDNRHEGYNRYEQPPRRPPPQYNEPNLNHEQPNQNQPPPNPKEDAKQEKIQEDDLNALAEQMNALGLHLDPKKMTPQQLQALFTQLQKLNLDEPAKQG
ncbi:hypothetical protein THRCLA_07227 [Thraustotheca clavata]|uniref:FYVE-type domain-containing protein n=1 Tax=Thraustotheca clavata TaxID=74557 RepID=A0A1V9ZFD9_9STRA|nr:hypothetical protein THRCLA_07227 [Thraustotheca clavata]